MYADADVYVCILTINISVVKSIGQMYLSKSKSEQEFSYLSKGKSTRRKLYFCKSKKYYLKYYF